jgi:hypothetical protein
MQLARFKKIGVKGNLYIIFVLLSFTSKVKWEDQNLIYGTKNHNHFVKYIVMES